MRHTLDELLDGIAAADPGIRDGWAYQELSAGIASGLFAHDIDHIRGRAVEHLSSAEIQARAFAPLVLKWLVEAGDRDESPVARVSHWYCTETDIRGHDEQLGWLHAVAHGSDYVGAAVRADLMTAEDGLTVLAQRLTRPSSVWVDQENARVAAAAVAALCSAERSDNFELALEIWAAAIEGSLDAFEIEAALPESSPFPPAWLTNVYSTLATLYVAVGEEPKVENGHVLRNVTSVQRRCAQTLSRMSPWLFRPRS